MKKPGMPPLLVDGHNLIGQIQDLSLDDPYDEAKLSMAIRSYCMRSQSKATIIFDNGLPGGVSRELSNSLVTVIFAPPGVSADHLLMRRAKEMGASFILVTSDRRILRLAHAYGLETMPSEEFALMIGFRPAEVEEDEPPKAEPPRNLITFEKDPNPVVTPQEIAYWLPIFKRRLLEARIKRRQSESEE
ncbi:MAG: NYN domain-containing protein [Anaerolineae bacterium]|nr:NYN domain-containing protein [Anaerolineae bacterium]